MWQAEQGRGVRVCTLLSLMGCVFRGALVTLKGRSDPCPELGRLEPPRERPGQVSLAHLALASGQTMCELGEAPTAVLKHIRLDLEEEPTL